MNVKPKQCPACKSFYNELVYNSCPHCQIENESEKNSVVKEFWSGFTNGRKNKSRLKNKEVTSDTKLSEEESRELPSTIEFSEEEGKTISPTAKFPETEEREIPPTTGFPGAEEREIPPTTGFPRVEEREIPPITGFSGGEKRKELSLSPTMGFFRGESGKSLSPGKEHGKNILFDKTSSSTLQQSISQRGRTIGKYFSGSNGENIDPVVGWLVCVKGAYFGQSFQLKSGKNKIGRSHEMDVKLLNDQSVSRSCQAVIIYDSKAGDFSILAGESDSLCYVDGKALYERVVLSGHEEIEFGDSEKNKFVFMPLCGEHFKWSSYELGKEKGTF